MRSDTITPKAQGPKAQEPDAQELQLRIGPDEVLHYWTLGDPQNPLMIMQHGMRDVGRSLLPVAQALSDQFYCVLPDLRGHGKSFKPGSYAIAHYLMDLRRLQHALQPEGSNTAIHLLGHSLGGHITCRYAGLYPSEVESLVVIEGLGPPPRAAAPDNKLGHVAMSLDRALVTAKQAATPRVMPNLEEAVRRLQKNNPRAAAQWVEQLARWSTAPKDNGLVWSFDPRAQEVFLGVSEAVNFDYWRAISARTLVVTGDLGYQYWAAQFGLDDYNGHFKPADWQERMDALSEGNPLKRAQHKEISGAGHQVHYDQPQELADLVKQWLAQP